MAAGKLQWDKTGERFYETGVDQGVLYVYKDNPTEGENPYDDGVVWNGLTTVSENPSGAEPTALWADNIKYLTLMSAEDFSCTIEAYTYPDEFMDCDGTRELTDGVYVHQQTRKKFGFCYRTKIGNDVQGEDLGYKIHLVYGCLASPSEKSYATINDSPEAITFSWEVSTEPVKVSDIAGDNNTTKKFRPTAYLEIDSTTVGDEALAKLEKKLYGSDNTAEQGQASNATAPQLPLPDEVLEIINAN